MDLTLLRVGLGVSTPAVLVGLGAVLMRLLSVMPSGLVIASLMVDGGKVMMFRRLVMVLSCAEMMLARRMLRCQGLTFSSSDTKGRLSNESPHSRALAI